MQRALERFNRGLTCDIRTLAALAVVALLGAVGCQEGPKVAKMGSSVETGDMNIEVTGYDVRKLEIIEGDRTHEYTDPVMAVDVELTNTGKEAFRYVPNHDSETATETSSSLLYYDPGKEASLPPEDKRPFRINGVTFEKGDFDEQVDGATKVEPGDSLTDVMLFQVPDEKQADLILSLPPSVHRGGKPVLFRIPYQEKTPEGPTWHGRGDTATLDGVGFSVTEVTTEYAELEPSGDAEKAFSNEPVLKVSYELKNESDSPITYNPGHRTVSGRRGAALFGKDNQFPRVRFSNTSVVGQQTDSRKIKPGAKLKDFSVFERPGKGLEVLKFEYPASRFEREGLVRFNLPYTYETPDKPEALAEAQKEDDEE